MKFALFIGCNIPARVQEYELSSRAVLKELGVSLTDIREFNCCGYPVRNHDYRAFMVSSARNLALAEKEGMDILCLCKCCFGSLRKADHALKADVSLRDNINGLLAKEGLGYDGGIEVTHLLQVLYHDIGVDSIREKVTRPYNGLKIAAHYGCHALRPSSITQFDDPVSPVIFDRLVEVTGAESVYWPLRLECCGAPALGLNDDLSVDLTKKKIADGKKAGADYLCSACPYCQLQFDMAGNATAAQADDGGTLRSVLYPQLLEIGMGIDRVDRAANGLEAFLA